MFLRPSAVQLDTGTAQFAGRPVSSTPPMAVSAPHVSSSSAAGKWTVDRQESTSAVSLAPCHPHVWPSQSAPVEDEVESDRTGDQPHY